VLECDPYEWAVVTDASFEPGAIPIGDPRESARIRVTLGTCGANTPATPRVLVQAVFGGGDAGGTRRMAELTTVRAVDATSTTIDVTVPNPFTIAGGVPTETNILLRFLPVVDGCDGTALEIPYRTGPTVRF
jgi:hypothetical protein